MSQAKHTPGPWEFEPSTPEDGVRCVFIFGAKCKDGYRPEIGAVYGPQDAKAFADARLIAAAPDLLDALGTLLNRLEGIGGEHVTGMEGVDADLMKANAAIAKATGSQ